MKYNRKRRVRETKEWLNKDFNVLTKKDRPLAGLNELLVSNDLDNNEIGEFGIHLHMYSVWKNEQAFQSIMNGDAIGWRLLNNAFLYEYYKVYINTVLWEKDSRRIRPPRIMWDEIFPCLAYSLAFNEDEMSHWLYSKMLAGISNGCYGVGVDESYVIPFVMKLYEVCFDVSDPIEVEIKRMNHPDPYKKLFEAWEDETELQVVINTLCDYHIERSVDNNRLIGEFSCRLLDVIPLEIWALQVVRKRLGLNTLLPDHPLLEDPLGSVPSKIPLDDDELLSKVRDWIKLNL